MQGTIGVQRSARALLLQTILVSFLPIAFFATAALGTRLTIEPGRSALATAILLSGLAMQLSCLTAGLLASRARRARATLTWSCMVWLSSVLAIPVGFAVRVVMMVLRLY